MLSISSLRIKYGNTDLSVFEDNIGLLEAKQPSAEYTNLTTGWISVYSSVGAR